MGFTHSIVRAPAGVGANVTATVYVTAGTRWASKSLPFFSYDAPTVTHVTALGNLPTSGGGKVKVVGTDLGRPISLELGTDNTGEWVTHAVCANVEYTSLQEVSCELSPGVGGGLILRVKADNLYSDPYAIGRLKTSAPYLLSYDDPEVFGINVSSKMCTTGNIFFTILGATLVPSLELDLKLTSLQSQVRILVRNYWLWRKITSMSRLGSNRAGRFRLSPRASLRASSQGYANNLIHKCALTCMRY
jgi:hypothetical protein